MGAQGLILIVLLCALGLFYVQNLTPLALVFLGFNLPTLPLSLWVISAFAAGFISSWLISLLSYSPPLFPKTSPISPPSPPPPREMEDIPSSKPDREAYPSPQNQRKATTAPEEVPLSYYNNYTEELPGDSVGQSQRETDMTPHHEDEEKPLERAVEGEINKDEEQWLKPRPAATYSYTPREKTVIRVKPSDSPKSAKDSPDIYDAPYRLISPPP